MPSPGQAAWPEQKVALRQVAHLRLGILLRRSPNLTHAVWRGAQAAWLGLAILEPRMPSPGQAACLSD
eukprot:15180913-Alexandrium_andersonii.AAC.1